MLELPPPLPGSYGLFLHLPEPAQITVGRFGLIYFPGGWYVYTGSAFGPGGLAARLSHHLRRSARPHWHIDYLRMQAEVLGYVYQTGEPGLECDWAKMLFESEGQVIARKFGASDCRSGCPAHLLWFPPPANLEWFFEKFASQNRDIFAVK